MGGCLSSESAEEVEQKKKSRQIDAALEEDSRRLRKECKILLLGMPFLELCKGSMLILVKAPEKVANLQLSNR